MKREKEGEGEREIQNETNSSERRPNKIEEKRKSKMIKMELNQTNLKL